MHQNLKEKSILIIDDNLSIGEMIKLYGSKFGIEIAHLADPRSAILHIKDNNYDIIILDISMPYIDGFELYDQIKQFSNIPIIFLSARGQTEDRLNGLLLGANDYLVKPFSLAELFIRIENIIARPNTLIEDNLVCINLETRLIRYQDREVRLTPKAFDIFVYLVRNKGSLCVRSELMKNVLGNEYYLEDRVIDAHIKEIRKKLSSDIISTVRGCGYIYD